VALLLHEERAARLVEQHALDATLPGLEAVIDRLVDRAFGPSPADGYEAEIQRVIQRAVADGLQRLAGDADMPQVRAVVALALQQLAARAVRMAEQADQTDRAARAHFTALAEEVRRYLTRGYEPAEKRAPPAPPPGAPIGGSRTPSVAG
jgi:hypothetical protein